ncbi:tetratricopeptide repeat protein [Streptomyces sp. NPDC052610]|uniref:tetratricopeptide repeat protein n=1 Tax=Streptomyces sp. NPDC052610 TaxID=3154952 RepID=UPI0034256461
MSRLSREQQPEQQRPSAPLATPIDVRVLADAEPGTDRVTVGGTPLTPAPGEEPQQAVLNHLHRIALATGHPVLATIHDERIGYVVPLQVSPDGSSTFTGRPAAAAPASAAQTGGALASAVPASAGQAGAAPVGVAPAGAAPSGATSAAAAPASAPPFGAAPADVTPPPATPPAATPSGTAPDGATKVLRLPAQLEQQAQAACGPSSNVTSGSAPTFRMRAVPEQAVTPSHAPGTVAPPTGVFGPPPVMDSKPLPLPHSGPGAPPRADDRPTPPAASAGASAALLTPDAPPRPDGTPLVASAGAPATPLTPDARPRPDDIPAGAPAAPLTPDTPPRSTPPTPSTGAVALPAQAPAPSPAPSPRPRLLPDPAPSSSNPDPKPTPPRGFDAVAEAVLGDDNALEQSVAPTPLTAPLARISEAVKEGRIDAAAGLAEEALRDGAAMLGQDHPEVLRLGELAAYVAYLAGDPVRAFRRSVELVHARRRTGDAEGAYGNVQSAATAWRAVRDPLLGLDLGRELIALWAELVAEPGPAAEDAEELESAHARMNRLADRAARRSGD